MPELWDVYEKKKTAILFYCNKYGRKGKSL